MTEILDKSEYINKVYCTDEIKGQRSIIRDIEKFLSTCLMNCHLRSTVKVKLMKTFRDIRSITIVPDDVFMIDNRDML